MTPAARVSAAINVLDHILMGEPAEKALTGWARRSRFAGSGDRAAIRDLVFDALRRKRSAAVYGGAMTGRGLMLGLLRERGLDPAEIFTGEGHAPAPVDVEEESGHVPAPGPVASDIPDWLWPAFCDSLGDRAQDVAVALQRRGPVMLRVNSRKATRLAACAHLLEDGVEAVADPVASTALQVVAGARKVAQSRAYLEGFVELQDGASQAILDELRLPSDGKILDYCAGGGGKTLAIAAQSDALIFAHDHDPKRMKDLPARAQRAGVSVSLVDPHDLPGLAPFDLVLCDAPCSGSGAWRRAPEGKWALTPARLEELTRIQDQILQDAALLVGPQAMLVYATCSVLRSENEDRIDAFLQNHPSWRALGMKRWYPGPSGDGFFAAQLQRV